MVMIIYYKFKDVLFNIMSLKNLSDMIFCTQLDLKKIKSNDSFFLNWFKEISSKLVIKNMVINKTIKVD